jgi:hypothetical protein
MIALAAATMPTTTKAMVRFDIPVLSQGRAAVY